jgi:ParB family transcriptional regulator, chromosome partitioning protein
LGRVVVELTIVFAASHSNAPAVLKDAAAVYKVDTDAIVAKVKQEFAAKDKARAEKKPPVKTARAKKSASTKKAA